MSPGVVLIVTGGLDAEKILGKPSTALQQADVSCLVSVRKAKEKEQVRVGSNQRRVIPAS